MKVVPKDRRPDLIREEPILGWVDWAVMSWLQFYYQASLGLSSNSISKGPTICP